MVGTEAVPTNHVPVGFAPGATVVRLCSRLAAKTDKLRVSWQNYPRRWAKSDERSGPGRVSRLTVDALELTQDFELASYTREGGIWDRQMLEEGPRPTQYKY